MSNIDQQIQNFETAFQQTKIQATSPTQNEVKADQNIFKQNEKPVERVSDSTPEDDVEMQDESKSSE